jgi:hypothetical protein
MVDVETAVKLGKGRDKQRSEDVAENEDGDHQRGEQVTVRVEVFHDLRHTWREHGRGQGTRLETIG